MIKVILVFGVKFVQFIIFSDVIRNWGRNVFTVPAFERALQVELVGEIAVSGALPIRIVMLESWFSW